MRSKQNIAGQDEEATLVLPPKVGWASIEVLIELNQRRF